MTAVFIAEAPARDAVAAGAQLLDQLDAEARRHGRPDAAWELSIDPSLLDVDDPRLCPFGQTYGDFWDAPLVADLDINPGWGPNTNAARAAARHRAQVLGFWHLPTPGQEDDEDDPGNSDELNRRWREEVAARAARRTAARVLAA